jgi:hypothetical protein
MADEVEKGTRVAINGMSDEEVKGESASTLPIWPSIVGGTSLKARRPFHAESPPTHYLSYKKTFLI